MYIRASVVDILDDSFLVRYQAAASPNTPPRVLEQLANDRSSGVRRAVANNPNTPVSTFEQLVADPSSDVRMAVIANPQVPDQLKAAITSLTNYNGVVEFCFGVEYSDTRDFAEKQIKEVLTSTLSREGYTVYNIWFDDRSNSMFRDDICVILQLGYINNRTDADSADFRIRDCINLECGTEDGPYEVTYCDYEFLLD